MVETQSAFMNDAAVGAPLGPVGAGDISDHGVRNTFLRRAAMPLAVAVGGASLLFSGLADAGGRISVKPHANLRNGSRVEVSGGGFAANSIGSLLLCNNNPNQPTIEYEGNKVPVSCSRPSALVRTTATGKLPKTAFIVHSGVIGPPAEGTDSRGHSAAADAKKFPCDAHTSCSINYGNIAGNEAAVNISYAR